MQFAILGPLEVRRDGRPVALGGAKPRALLAVLLLEANQPVSAERLAVALWGEDAAAGSVRTVQVHLSRLRRALAEEGRIATTPAGYRLRVGPDELDLERFERLSARGRAALAGDEPDRAAAQLREALSLWRGPALADLADEPFAQTEIARLEELRWTAMETRIDADLAAGRHEEVIAELQRRVAEQPLRERLHGQLMLALYRCGRQADALSVYREARARLVEQLGAEPGPDLRALERAILTHDPALGLPPEHPRPRSGALPARTTALFGRDGDLAAIGEILSAGARLLTLTGPGGVGKTALALEAARRQASRFADGARVVELAAVRDPLFVPAATAQALGIEMRGAETPQEALARSLADRHELLVFDNFEHVLEAGPLVADLVRGCPAVAILCTSRAPLALSAERRFPVRPLPVPSGEAPDGEASIAMFCDRVQARDPAFALTPANRAAVADICRRVGGLPLALELAAARMGFLSAEELAAGLDQALALLVGGPRDVPDRQRTLRATLDWSHRLLSAEQRRAFAGFAVFAGGATLDAALEVTGADLPTLEALSTQHLLHRADQRLGMLEPVREYAAERLDDLDGAGEVRRRHAEFYARLAARAAPRQAAVLRERELEMFSAEEENLRGAIVFALAQRDAELALDLTSACSAWWRATGQTAEGRDRAEAVMTLAGDAAPPRFRARALTLRSSLWARSPGAIERWREDLIASVALWRQLGDTEQQIECLASLSRAELWRGAREEARTRAAEALGLARQVGDDALIGRALAGTVMADPDHPDAARRARAAVPSLLRAERFWDAVSLLGDVGYVALAGGRLGDARQLIEAAARLDETTASPNPVVVFHTSGNLGLVHLFLGDDASAADALGRSLEAARHTGIADIGEALRGLAVLAVRRGEHEDAARLAGAADAHTLPSMTPEERRVQERLRAGFLPGRERLGGSAWDALAGEGRRLDVAAAIDLGLAAASSPSTPAFASALASTVARGRRSDTAGVPRHARG